MRYILCNGGGDYYLVSNSADIKNLTSLAISYVLIQNNFLLRFFRLILIYM